MTKNTGIRKTLELLLKKLETLENQSFAQKLAIDELENKLQRAETLIKQVRENPFGVVTYSHVCVAGAPDWTGASYCTICGAHMSGGVHGPMTVTNTGANVLTSTGSGTTYSVSSGEEEVLDLDISWIVDDSLK